MGKLNENGGRIFKNSFLESFTKSNPQITISFYSLFILMFLILNFKLTTTTSFQTVIIYTSALFCWTFMEYFLHRYLFHIDEYFPKLKRLHYMLHGVHHDHPRDQQRLFMPPLPGTIISAFLFLFWYIFLGSYTFAFMAGIVNGYLIYSYIHYSVHTKAVFPPLRFLWKHHALHHYKYHDKAYGVSSPLWDIIFGTMPSKSKN